MQELLFSLGYAGAFLAGIISSFTIFLPTPGFVAVFLIAGMGFDPLLVGFLAGLGAAIGETLGFALGWGAKKTVLKKYKEKLGDIEKLFNKYKGSLVIFFFAATPLPFDLIGIFCGTIGYSIKKFFLACLAGKLVKYWLIAYAGYYGVQWIAQIMGV